MDRDAIARRRRRDQVLEALTFERQREAALRDQLEEVVLEQDGPRIDAEAFARMEPDDVAVVRELLDGGWSPVDDDEDDDDGLEVDEDEDEVERLQGEIESCRARQRALERYLEALELPPAAAPEG
ncbi:MAG TPA: hypothetical protein VFR43_10285 [Gaiellaceae bacterium]|nr:hypothetical protein [Gaiellaceae bacterium]